jgi:hypothetical protein
MQSVSKFPQWNLTVMYVLFAVIFGFEMLGVFNSHFVTITAIIRDFIPRWARWMILGWMTYHFGVQ